MSPVIDLVAAGLKDMPGKFVETCVYAEPPLLNYLVADIRMQWYAYQCGPGAPVTWSPLTGTGLVYYFLGVPYCSKPGEPATRTAPLGSPWRGSATAAPRAPAGPRDPSEPVAG